VPCVPQPFGLFNVNKPRGATSRRVVDVVKRLVKPAKAGHAGTLDPLATGVLVVCVGPATKLIEAVQQAPKTYAATFLLGRRSETDDLEGHVVEVDVPNPPSEADVRAVLPEFVGAIDQVPPAFSAVHVDGQRAYKLARRGREVEIEPRTVEVFGIVLRRFEYPEVELEIRCGSGTYVRSIGRDLGERLGCGAVMSDLERTAIGPFLLKDAVSPDELSLVHLVSPLACLGDLPRFRCDAALVGTIVHGRPLAGGREAGFTEETPVALVAADDTLLGLAEYWAEEGVLQPRTVFVRP
jgi:tRNA pseudouridine55 synthase